MSKTPHIRHLENRTLKRTRHSEKLLKWLDATCERLDMTADAVFELLRKNSAEQIDQMQPDVDEPPVEQG